MTRSLMSREKDVFRDKRRTTRTRRRSSGGRGRGPLWSEFLELSHPNSGVWGVDSWIVRIYGEMKSVYIMSIS